MNFSKIIQKYKIRQRLVYIKGVGQKQRVEIQALYLSPKLICSH